MISGPTNRRTNIQRLTTIQRILTGSATTGCKDFQESQHSDGMRTSPREQIRILTKTDGPKTGASSPQTTGYKSQSTASFKPVRTMGESILQESAQRLLQEVAL